MYDIAKAQRKSRVIASRVVGMTWHSFVRFFEILLHDEPLSFHLCSYTLTHYSLCLVKVKDRAREDSTRAHTFSDREASSPSCPGSNSRTRVPVNRAVNRHTTRIRPMANSSPTVVLRAATDMADTPNSPSTPSKDIQATHPNSPSSTLINQPVAHSSTLLHHHSSGRISPQRGKCRVSSHQTFQAAQRRDQERLRSPSRCLSVAERRNLRRASV